MMFVRRRHRDDWDDFAALRDVVIAMLLVGLIGLALGFWAGRATAPTYTGLSGYDEHLLRRAARY